MHQSVFPPERGVAGIPWGLDSQNKPCLQEFDGQLWHIGGTLDVPRFEGPSREFLKQNFVTWVEN